MTLLAPVSTALRINSASFFLILATSFLLGSLLADQADAQMITLQNSDPHGPRPPSEVTLYPRVPWNHTGVKLEKGRRYRITASIMIDDEKQPYADDRTPCTPAGPIGLKGWILDTFARNPRFPLNPARWLGPGKIKQLRVLLDREGTRASFLTVIGCVDEDDTASNAIVIGWGREIVAYATGELVLFSNDWPGGSGVGEHRFDGSRSYGNNTGLVRIRVEYL